MKKKLNESRLGGLVLIVGMCVALGAACDLGPEPYTPPDETVVPPVQPPEDPCDTQPGICYNPVKANVILLVDRSGSMAEPADCGQASCPSKWEQLLGLSAYLPEAKELANLGLAVFPSPEYNGCEVAGGLLVPLSGHPNVDDHIMTAIAQVRPGGKTPVASALDELRLSGAINDPDRDNTIVILTDGKPNCACAAGDDACERDAAVAAIQRLENGNPPVDIDVIGFGASALEAQETLTAMAQAAGDDRYYQSDTIEDLISTMYGISVGKIPCTFDLDEWPEPDKLIVWMDNVQVPPCSTDPCESGYTYDPSEGVVEFHGATCNALRDGESHNVWFDQLP